MLRDATYSDLNQLDANQLDAADQAAAGFVMDEEAFRAFYDRNARGVWAYLARLTGDRQMADDLLQETFYRFLRAATMHDKTHDSEAHRRNSLYRIATNLARDARRRTLTRPLAQIEGDAIEGVAARTALIQPSGARISRGRWNA